MTPANNQEKINISHLPVIARCSEGISGLQSAIEIAEITVTPLAFRQSYWGKVDMGARRISRDGEHSITFLAYVLGRASECATCPNVFNLVYATKKKRDNGEWEMIHDTPECQISEYHPLS